MTKRQKSLVWSSAVLNAVALLIITGMPVNIAWPSLLIALAVVNLLIWIPFPGRDWKGRFSK